MPDPMITVRGIGKKYRIGKVGAKRKNLRDSLTSAIRSPFEKLGGILRGDAYAAAGLGQIFWALEDINFDVNPGEVVGIIGRNGAGKSTLLKILSRITIPETGYANIYGRIASLLEVGTGFHPELTGRENIYLNGSILGMSRMEIDRKLDEIIAFAEINRFIDTPIKHYSSGMGVRLAFAVAAHLEPEVLIVDEVLAVGDAEFQRKCLNKMEDVGAHGRTVLFVSHNMPAVTRMCPRILLLDKGRLIEDGNASEVVRHYLSSGSGSPALRIWEDDTSAPGRDIAKLREVKVLNPKGDVAATVDIREPVVVEMVFQVDRSGRTLFPHFRFFNHEGVALFTTLDRDPEWMGKPRAKGTYRSRVKIPGNFFAEGSVLVSAGAVCTNPVESQFYEADVVSFQIIENEAEVGETARGSWSGSLDGAIRPMLDWDTSFTGSTK